MALSLPAMLKRGVYRAPELGVRFPHRLLPPMGVYISQAKMVGSATPAISDGMIVIRTLGHVYGIGSK